MASSLAEHITCTGPESSGKQARHELDTSNTIFGRERAGRPLQESLGPFRYQLPITLPMRRMP